MAVPQTEADRGAAHRRELITQFAWGVAHDFSNFLQVILGFAEFLRAQHREDQELSENLGEIVVAAERARRFVGQLLVVAQRGEFTLEAADLNALVRRLEPSLRSTLGERIALELRLAPGPLPLALDVPGVEQIVTHLCAQAYDAMARDGGTLTISTELVQRPSGECCRTPARRSMPPACRALQSPTS